MRSEGWQITEELEEFVAAAEDFLRAEPDRHNTPLTILDRLRRRGSEGVVFGWTEGDGGEVGAVFYRLGTGRVTVTPVGPEQADALAVRLVGLGERACGVTADHDSATAFAEAWRRRTGAEAVRDWRGRLHRLDALVPPERMPEGRVAARAGHEQVVCWCRQFCVDVGERATVDLLDSGAWEASRFADKHFTFWETPDGTPVSMAGSTGLVGGMVRVDPVSTPAHLRGHGYAAAVTVEVTRAALAAGAEEVVLFTDPGNPTSNALYRRIGYVPLCEYTGYAFREGATA
ncbi:GNAT family N-acetyltransferase [Streptomyces sp. NPDC090106]|uniref:GNAT family N-acetyltransferase n=1 Tax=Streptomyces sp. NPDC090106 TaxID=3365946 RepID=UPI0037F93782